METAEGSDLPDFSLWLACYPFGAAEGLLFGSVELEGERSKLFHYKDRNTNLFLICALNLLLTTDSNV